MSIVGLDNGKQTCKLSFTSYKEITFNHPVKTLSCPDVKCMKDDARHNDETSTASMPLLYAVSKKN